MNSRLTEKCFKNMNGAYAALFTPFDAKGRVNPEMIEKIVNYGIRNGLNGFYLTGTTGEWWLLALAKYAAKIGIDWISSITPQLYRKPFEPLTTAQYTAYAKRFAKLGIVKQGAALK